MNKRKAIDLTFCEFDLSKTVDTKGGFFIPEQKVQVEKPNSRIESLVESFHEGQVCEMCPSIGKLSYHSLIYESGSDTRRD